MLISQNLGKCVKFVKGVIAFFVIFENINCVRSACYHMQMLSFRTTETPEYRFVMQMHNNNTLSSITRVIEPVQTPMWNLILVQYNTDERRRSMKVLYNATFNVCEFMSSIKRMRIFNNVADALFKSGDAGNLSLACPLEVDTYVLKNIHIPPDTGILKFMYKPNTLFGMFGNVYSQLSTKEMVLKCSYEINGTVKKTC